MVQVGNINTKMIQVWHIHKNIDKAGWIAAADATTWIFFGGLFIKLIEPQFQDGNCFLYIMIMLWFGLTNLFYLISCKKKSEQ